MVISNNLPVVDQLDGRDGIEVVVVGGQVRRGDRAVVGPLAMEFIRTFKVDYALIGASALDPDGSLLDFSVAEVQVTQTIIRNARQVILVADSSKLGRPAPVRIGQVADIDYLVTDRLIDPGFLRLCEDGGVKVVTAG
jgi:DeoR family glycerol-3-phosphate regulon repressor